MSDLPEMSIPASPRRSFFTRKTGNQVDMIPPWHYKLPFAKYKAKLEDYFKKPRKVQVNESPALMRYRFISNKVRTTKYSWWSFVPVNLFEQFKRAANLWFLLVACLQLIPGVSPINPVTSFVPLIFVLAVSAIKEAFEDQKRRIQDREMNNQSAEIIRGGQRQTVLWEEIQVGDLVRVLKNQSVPADLILLSSSDDHDCAYMETAAIDGETNLKKREALKATATKEDMSNFKATIHAEGPDPAVWKFIGSLQLPGRDDQIPLSINQFMHRGCVLRNTEWAIGAVVYTGHETKLMRNTTRTRAKRSALDKDIDKGVYQLMAFVIGLCILCAVLAGLFITFIGKDHPYLDLKNDYYGSYALQGVKAWVTFLILFSVMIPISLYVTMEIVKVILAYLIEQDLQMYHAETNTPAKARTSNLVEQLGQIEYIFSDKTGTLTSNKMDFMKCSIGGVSYGKYENKDDKGEGKEPDFTFDDPRLLEDLRNGSEVIRWFLTTMAVCHTVVIESNDSGELTYQASSPDEGALVLAANRLGFVYTKKVHDSVFINVHGKEEEYKILNVLEFSSDRKRMSVIARCPDGKIRLFSKGADEKVLSTVNQNSGGLLSTTKTHLQDFSVLGLRTLCFAYAEIDEAEYEKWNKQFYEASIALDDRENKIQQVATLIEKDLTLLGATAVEDKLQDGVPEAIECLQKANIKIWVLTGDKEETAINIGYSSALLNEDMIRMLLNEQNCPTKEACSQALDNSINMAKGRGDKPAALVIDGATLNLIFGDKAMELKLYQLGRECASVICCRCAAKQKQLVVKLIQENDKAECLAIGDGANDVPMIQAAQIGVGISGKEGLQAVNSSDYSIGQFRYLVRLLLIHGRWDYKRLSKLFLYCFYKNMAISLTQLWFAIFSGFGGQTIFDSWAIALYNTIFTSLPIICFAVFDQDVSAQKVMEYPQLYETGQKGHEWSLKLLWSWIGLGIFQSIVIFFITFFTFYRGTILTDGTVADLFAAGTTAYTAMILVVNFILMFEFNYWTVWSHIVSWGSIAVWFLFMIFYQFVAINQNEMYYLSFNLFRSPTYWLTVICVTGACLMPYLFVKIVKRNLYPENFHIIQEQMYLGIKSKPKKKSLGRRMVDGIYTGFAFSRKQ
eukprot:TRINITY_DN7518_c0_g1_i1.p1 TRINITY_DN7518_c0_g1~~TRINITY_DN7518_c0_g1_i1.p1  ORF type:complete len:1131 (+),score=258.43 TRINITY_DN7518_c0_g1_i1:213-3605(+)